MSASASDVREWAKDKGHEVGSRGRFSADLIAAFNKGRKADHRYADPAR